MSYWDPRDRSEGVGVDYEVHIDGLPETCGLAAIVAEQPDTLIELTSVCAAAAVLLAEAQRSKG